MKKITGIYVNPKHHASKIVTVKADLDAYNKLLDCSCIDVVTRRIGRKQFEIICDDEGTLKDDPLISAISNLGCGMLVGSLLIVAYGGDGNLRELTAEEAAYVTRRIQRMPTRQHPEGLLMVTQCGY